MHEFHIVLENKIYDNSLKRELISKIDRNNKMKQVKIILHSKLMGKNNPSQ